MDPLHEPPLLVYGDSSPFPYELDFLALTRGVVTCGVALLHAQRAIDAALEKTSQLDETTRRERARFDAMVDTVKLSMTAFMSSSSNRVAEVAVRILETTRGMIEGERVLLGERAGEQRSGAETAVDEARASAFRALETLLLNHDVPPTGIALRLLAGEESYGAQAALKTPFGVDAVVALAIPSTHEWGKLRRVGQLCTGVDARLSAPSWLSRNRDTASYS